MEYYALLREQRGVSSETIETDLNTYAELYDFLHQAHGFTVSKEQLRIARNESFADFSDTITDGDTVVFITPVSGG